MTKLTKADLAKEIISYFDYVPDIYDGKVEWSCYYPIPTLKETEQGTIPSIPKWIIEIVKLISNVDRASAQCYWGTLLSIIYPNGDITLIPTHNDLFIWASRCTYMCQDVLNERIASKCTGIHMMDILRDAFDVYKKEVEVAVHEILDIQLEKLYELKEDDCP